MNQPNVNRIHESRRGPRWVIAKNAHRIRDLRASGKTWAEVAGILGEEHSIKINKETLARAMKPFSTTDSRASIVVAMEKEVESLDQALAFADQVNQLLARQPAHQQIQKLVPALAGAPLGHSAKVSSSTTTPVHIGEKELREKAQRTLGPHKLRLD